MNYIDQTASSISAEILNPLCILRIISSVIGLFRFSTSETRLALYFTYHNPKLSARLILFVIVLQS